MKKVRLCIVIVIITIPLLCGCGAQEEELGQSKDNVVLSENAESNQRNKEDEGIKNDKTEAYESALESDTSRGNVTNANEIDCDSVYDGELTLTLGMVVEEFYDYYDEEEIPSVTTPTHLVTSDVRNGEYYKWYFHDFSDFSISTTNYYEKTDDLTEEIYIICKIELWTLRFQTSKGIKVGDSLEKLSEAYGEELQKISEDRYDYVENDVTTSFYMEQNHINKISIAKLKWW